MSGPGFASSKALARFRLLQPHLEQDIPLARIAVERGIAERTLHRWLAAWRTHGILGLERARRSDAGVARRLAPEIEALVRSLATRRPRPTAAAIHRKVQAEATARGLAAPSYSVVAGIVRGVEPARIAAATDAAAYRDRHELVHRRDADAPNAMWQADHTMLDILVIEDGKPVRPWLTVVMDDHSRAIAGFFLTSAAPSAANTALALRQAIWRKDNPGWPVCGIPEQLYVDNGSDFISENIEQACIALKIRLIHSRPGRPRGRGKIERFFRMVNDMFLPDIPGHLINGKPLSEPARYPQLYSRIGFVHEFKPLREAEMRLVAARHGAVFGINFDQESLGGIEALAAVIRLTRGNLRLVERLLAQMRRIMDINTATGVTLEVVEAARDRLVIGPGD